MTKHSHRDDPNLERVAENIREGIKEGVAASNATAFADNICAGYEVDGFDAGKLLPGDIGPIIRVNAQVIEPGKNQAAFGLLFDAETAVAMAKSILLTAAQLGVSVE